MEEFEASEIVARVAEGELPNLKHSCTPSTYKGVGEQVKIKMVDIRHYCGCYLKSNELLCTFK